MKRRSSIIHAIVIDCLLIGAILSVIYIKYTNQFANAKIVGDWKRIPLWYPHEIVDFGDGVGVRLNNWSSWKYPIDNTITVFSDASSDAEERAALKRLNDILELSVGDNVVCGVRITIRQLFREKVFRVRHKPVGDCLLQNKGRVH